MAKFVYRMQNILDIKSKLEVQAKNDFAQANAQLQQEQEQLQEMVSRTHLLTHGDSSRLSLRITISSQYSL